MQGVNIQASGYLLIHDAKQGKKEKKSEFWTTIFLYFMQSIRSCEFFHFLEAENLDILRLSGDGETSEQKPEKMKL